MASLIAPPLGHVYTGKPLRGAALADPYAYFSETRGDQPFLLRDSLDPFQIPEHSYFLLGDRRDRSYDSRFFGPVDQNKIYSQVRLIYFSWDAENSSVRWNRIGKIIK